LKNAPPQNALAMHLAELEVARDPSAPAHILPPIEPHDRAILDVGCGAGQTLIASELAAGTLAVGIDLDRQALALGRTLDQTILFVSGSAESLPFASRTFNLVYSRVALPYTDIPRAVAEIARVLRSGGRCWFTLHPPALAIQDGVRRLLRGQLKGAVLQLYALVNGLVLHLTGRVFRFPFGTTPLESCQTAGGITRVLRAAGLTDVKVSRGRHFVVAATKR
jgi:SAM-dependent methyltransferase